MPKCKVLISHPQKNAKNTVPFFFQKKKFKKPWCCYYYFSNFGTQCNQNEYPPCSFFFYAVQSFRPQAKTANSKHIIWVLCIEFHFFFAIFFKNALRNRKIVVQKLDLLSKWFHVSRLSNISRNFDFDFFFYISLSSNLFLWSFFYTYISESFQLNWFLKMQNFASKP